MSIVSRATVTPPPPYPAAIAQVPDDEPCIEIKCSKTREEKRHVQNGRRPSVHRDGWQRYTERRGSKDGSRCKNLVEPHVRAGRGSLGEKHEVLVIVAAKQWNYQLENCDAKVPPSPTPSQLSQQPLSSDPVAQIQES